MRRSGKSKILVTMAVGVVLATAAYAFTATNTVPASNAGAGSGTISGYTASAVTYTVNSTTPTDLDQVAFTIAPTTTSTVKVQLASGGSWYDCANSAGSVTCDTTSPQATVAAATQLTVVAVQ